MFIIKHSNSAEICINICFDIIKLNSKSYMVPVSKTAAYFGFVDN